MGKLILCASSLVVLLFFCGAGDAAPQMYAHDLDFEQVQEIVPVEAMQFFQSLTSQDKEVLKNVLSKGSSYTSVRDLLADLRMNSTTLYDKTVAIVSQMRQTIASLSKPARAFIDDTATQLNASVNNRFFDAEKLKIEANLIVKRFRGLDTKTQEELRRAFPMVTKVVYNNVFQTLAIGLLGIQPEAPQ